MKDADIAKKKTLKTYQQLLLWGMMAGFMIGIGGYSSQLITAAGLPKALSAAVFPVGLIMVILTGSELFTGNCLMFGAVVSNENTINKMLKVWITSYIGNILGSVILAYALLLCNPSEEYMEVAKNAALSKVSMSPTEMFIKAILCNMLVCIAVYTALMADNTAGKILATFVPVFVFVLCGFEHSVANMFFLTIGQADIFQTIYQISVVTVGNIIGGAMIGVMVCCHK